jgi:hypothetical protein
MSQQDSCECKDGTCECGGNCECCGGEARFPRRYQTKAEQVAELEAYLADLKLELQAVEERLADLRK